MTDFSAPPAPPQLRRAEHNDLRPPPPPLRGGGGAGGTEGSSSSHQIGRSTKSPTKRPQIDPPQTSRTPHMAEPGSDEWLIHQLRTRQRRHGWHTLMTAAADRLEQLTQEQQ